MIFPQYRMYSNGLSYFEILNESNFIEYKMLGKKVEVYNIEAKILPERNFIQDMLVNEGNHWLIIDEKEFNKFLNNKLLIN